MVHCIIFFYILLLFVSKSMISYVGRFLVSLLHTDHLTEFIEDYFFTFMFIIEFIEDYCFTMCYDCKMKKNVKKIIEDLINIKVKSSYIGCTRTNNYF